jgi:ABC-type antimicrobial peptide transport system permease subunit
VALGRLGRRRRKRIDPFLRRTGRVRVAELGVALTARQAIREVLRSIVATIDLCTVVNSATVVVGAAIRRRNGFWRIVVQDTGVSVLSAPVLTRAEYEKRCQ